MTQPKLGNVLEPLDDDSNTQTQNSIATYENPYTSCAGIQNHENPSCYYVPLLSSNATNEIIDKKECCVNMLYATALDVSHPKILEFEINKIGTMYACLDLKFHRELKLFLSLFKRFVRKTISNLLLLLEGVIMRK
jgi:hypothetical protein